MQLIPLRTGIIQPQDDLPALLNDAGQFEDGDIVVVSSKAAAMAEGRLIDLTKIIPGKEAEAWKAKLNRPNDEAAFRQAIIDETKRMHGTVQDTPYAMLTELKPDGLEHGTILTANAGLDRSNAPTNMTIGWPKDPVTSVKNIHEALQSFSGKKLGVMMTDSCCRPRRLGVTAFALTVSGFDPLRSEVGRKDLFGHALRLTQEAIADQLATAANFLMGNAEQSMPAVIIRDHGIPLSDFTGWVPGIDPEEDLFKGIL